MVSVCLSVCPNSYCSYEFTICCPSPPANASFFCTCLPFLEQLTHTGAQKHVRTHACTALHKWRETNPFHPRRGHNRAASERFPCQHVCSHQQGRWQTASNPRTSHAACSVSQFIWGLNYISRWMIALLLATLNRLSFTVCSVELPKGNLHLLNRPDKDSKMRKGRHKKENISWSDLFLACFN